jgi:hypothetical protein
MRYRSAMPIVAAKQIGHDQYSEGEGCLADLRIKVCQDRASGKILSLLDRLRHYKDRRLQPKQAAAVGNVVHRSSQAPVIVIFESDEPKRL